MSEKLTSMTREFNKWCQSNKIRLGVFGKFLYLYIPRGPAEAVAFFVRQSGPLSRTADMPESSTGNTNRQELMSLRRPPGWISV